MTKPRRASVDRAGPPVMDKDELRQAVLAELEPSGPLEDYLAGCVAKALQRLKALPEDDPFVLMARNELVDNLRELQRLQAGRRGRTDANASGS